VQQQSALFLPVSYHYLEPSSVDTECCPKVYQLDHRTGSWGSSWTSASPMCIRAIVRPTAALRHRGGCTSAALGGALRPAAAAHHRCEDSHFGISTRRTGRTGPPSGRASQPRCRDWQSGQADGASRGPGALSRQFGYGRVAMRCCPNDETRAEVISWRVKVKRKAIWDKYNTAALVAALIVTLHLLQDSRACREIHVLAGAIP